MSRFVFGPEIGVVELAHALGSSAPALADLASPPVAKLDVAVAFQGYTPDGRFEFVVADFSDSSLYNELVAIHVGLYPTDAAIPANAEDVKLAPYHYSVAPAVSSSQRAVVDASAAPAADYHALAVLEFAS